MPDPALLDPNNRLLGWSANDFSLYGGQPTVTLGLPARGEAGEGFVSVPSALPTGSGAPVSLAATLPDIAAAAAMPNDDATAAPGGWLPGGQTGLAAPSPSPSPASLPDPAVPDVVGSGSIASVAPIVSLLGVPNPPAVATPDVAPLVSPFSPPVLDLAPPAAAAGGITGSALNPAIVAPLVALVGNDAADAAGRVVADLDQAGAVPAELLAGLSASLPIDAIAAAVTPVGGAIVGTADAALVTATDTAAGIAAEAVDGLADTAGATLDLADQLADPVVVTVADTAAATPGAVQETTSAAAGTVAAVAATAVEPVEDAAAATTAATVDAAATATTVVGDAAALTLGAADAAIGGTDPAGGVATLVGMVESADLFDLGQIGDAPAGVTEGGSILDALAADEAPAALLGVAEDAGAALPGGDHHDDHGGLLGGL